MDWAFFPQQTDGESQTVERAPHPHPHPTPTPTPTPTPLPLPLPPLHQ